MSKKRKHGHHGGAWKVAYADFVTAMMALFLVLWLTSQSPQIKEAVERSFRNPFAAATKESTGIIPNKDTQTVRSSEGNFDSASVVELNMLRRIADDLMKMLPESPDAPDEKPISLRMTPEGMRISVFDRARRPVFQTGSAEFTPYGSWVFSTLAWEVARFTNAFQVELEGHTEPGLPPKNDQYSSWELSSDRANSARRKLLEHHVTDAQIRKVAGFADTQPLPEAAADDERQRRVTVLLKIKSGNRL